jgi:hypothetical protein
MNTTEQSIDKKPIEKAALSFTNNRILGILFCIALCGIVFVRRGLGVRILRIELIFFTTAIVQFIAAIYIWINSTPFIGRPGGNPEALQYFITIYMFVALFKMARAYIASRKAVFPYTRSLGDSYLQIWLEQLITKPIPWLSQMRFQAFVEPVVILVAGVIITEYFSIFLGLYVMLIALSTAAIGYIVITNEDEHRYDLNDARVLSQKSTFHIRQQKPAAGRKAPVTTIKDSTKS